MPNTAARPNRRPPQPRPETVGVRRTPAGPRTHVEYGHEAFPVVTACAYEALPSPTSRRCQHPGVQSSAYLVGVENSPQTKIGRTTGTLKSRTSQLQTSHHARLLPLLDVEGDYEGALHERFAASSRPPRGSRRPSP
ncbi:hypothetical protein GCM10010271_68670 [Streptomyces kurssanovii]|nr:hypothetical protein GCM10010271_68670 [Streptomyces kurssanovii]